MNPYPSTSFKSDILDMMFEECGRAGYEFDRTAGEDASALRRLDAMLAEWQAEGVNLNYNFPAIFGKGLPTDSTGIPDAAVNGVALWGAFRIAPGMGKTISPESRKALSDAKAFLRAETSSIPSVIFPRNTIRGTGNRFGQPWEPYQWESMATDITLATLVLSDTTSAAGVDYAATISGNAQGGQLTLISDVGGKYTLSGNLLRGTGLTAGTDMPVVREFYPGATNSPFDTTFSIVVT
jgi:P22 tail accessory factor